MTSKRSNGRSESSPDNDSGLSLQQVIEVGQAASHLLGNPVYNVAHRLCVDDLIARWSQTSPQEVKTRESLWHELQAHGRAAQQLGNLVERAKTVLESQQNEQNQSDAEYLDQQGFGYPPVGGAEQPFQ